MELFRVRERRKEEQREGSVVGEKRKEKEKGERRKGHALRGHSLLASS